jgi:hypothetical protein
MNAMIYLLLAKYIVIICCFICYAQIEGFREAAYFFDRIQASDPDKEDLHKLFTIQRLLVVVIACVGMMGMHIEVKMLLSMVLLSCSMALMFPFFHDGKYYATRNDLNKTTYIKRWKDQPSQTSTSLMDKSNIASTYSARLRLMIVGIAMVVASFVVQTMALH